VRLGSASLLCGDANARRSWPSRGFCSCLCPDRLPRPHDAQVPKCLNNSRFPNCRPPALLLPHGNGWLRVRMKLERWATMDSAPSSSRDDGLDFVRQWTPDRSSDWPKPLPSDMKNWSTPPPSNIQTSKKQSIGRRMSRAFTRYSIVFLMGIGATLAWHSYSDEAMEIVRTQVPSLAWLLPVATAKPSPGGQASAAALATSVELVEQLRPVALDLANVRRSVEQLGVKVEQLGVKVNQMSQSIVLQSVEQKLPPPPQSRVPPPKPPHPPGQ
jgi:hypothetical protein